MNESKKHALIAGTGRSGTTWCQQIINANDEFQVAFEPFIDLQSKDFSYTPYFSKRHQATPSQIDILSLMISIDSSKCSTLVKEIRCNLMLGWLQQSTPLTHLVMIIRHPLQVACSWRKLGWGKAMNSDRSDVDEVLGQPSLLNDYPIIANVLPVIDMNCKLESSVFIWCVHHLVASLQVQSDQALVVHYENLVFDPNIEITRLFEYLGLAMDWEKIKPVLKKYSRTTQASRKKEKRNSSLVYGWRQILTKHEIDRCNKIIRLFGLDDVYTPDGMPTNLAFFQD